MYCTVLQFAVLVFTFGLGGVTMDNNLVDSFVRATFKYDREVLGSKDFDELIDTK